MGFLTNNDQCVLDKLRCSHHIATTVQSPRAVIVSCFEQCVKNKNEEDVYSEFSGIL